MAASITWSTGGAYWDDDLTWLSLDAYGYGRIYGAIRGSISETETSVTVSATAYCEGTTGGDWNGPYGYRILLQSAFAVDGVEYQSPGTTVTYNGGESFHDATFTKTFSKTTTARTGEIYYDQDEISKDMPLIDWTKVGTFSIPALAKFTITYDANNGSNPPSATTFYYGKGATVTTGTPSRSGYAFTGWNTQADGSGTAYSGGQTYTTNSNLKLYAQWRKLSWTITFHANGGSGTMSALTKNTGSAVTLTANAFTRSGYRFLGWATSATGSVVYADKASYTTDANVDLYAVWQQITYTVSYNANNGTGTMANSTKIHGTTLTLRANAFTRTGYDFVGWATSSTGSKAYDDKASYTANAAVTLYALWRLKTYAVSYNANAGGDTVSGTMANSTKTYGSAMTLRTNAFKRQNYRFKGWSVSSSSNVISYTDGASYTDNSPITLYGVWELAYNNPTLSNVDIFRSNSSGAADDTGDHFHVNFTWSATNVTFINPIVTNLQYQIRYKTRATTTWTTAVAYTSDWSNGTASGTSKTHSVSITPSVTISTDSAYDIEVTIRDTNTYNTNSTATSAKQIASTYYTLDFANGGRGMGIGEAAPSEGLYVNMTPIFHTSVYSSKAINTSALFSAKNASSPDYISFGCDTSGTRRGIYDNATQRWPIYVDGTHTYIRSDTSSGRIISPDIFKLQANAIDTTLTSLSSQVTHYPIVIVDKNDTAISYIGVNQQPSGSNYTAIINSRIVNGTQVYNSLSLGLGTDGTKYVSVSDASVWRSAIGAFATSGGTLTGPVVITPSSGAPYFLLTNKGADISQGGANPSSASYGSLYFSDKTGTTAKLTGWIQSGQTTAGAIRTTMGARTYRTGSTAVSNTLALVESATGVGTVEVSHPAAWRTAIGAVAAEDSGWVTATITASGKTSSSTLYYRKKDGFVTIIGDYLSASTSGYETQFTLPSGYRPAKTVIFGCGYRGNSAPVVQITTAGVIGIYDGATTAAYHCFTITFPV